MGNLHRIIWIDRQIRNKRYPDRHCIADKFEISIRQVARDIEYMKYSLGAPIEYSAFHKGYYYNGDNFTLPSNFLTEDDNKILKYLAYQYSNHKDNNHYNNHSSQLAELFLRLSGNTNNDKGDLSYSDLNNHIDKDERNQTDGYPEESDEKDIPIFNLSSTEAEIFDLQKKAINKRLKVEMTYQNATFKKSKRIFCPYKLFYQHRHNYVVGYCQLREEIRIFRLDRINEISLLKENFARVSYFREEDYEEEVSFNSRAPYKAIILLNKPEMINNLHYSIRYMGDGRYKIEFYDSQQFFSDILAKSLSFTIESPNWLRNRLRKKLELLLKKNTGNDEKRCE